MPVFAEFSMPSEGFAPSAVVNGAEIAIVELYGGLAAKDIAAADLSGAGITDWTPPHKSAKA
jgi:hypothetical protein